MARAGQDSLMPNTLTGWRSQILLAGWEQKAANAICSNIQTGFSADNRKHRGLVLPLLISISFTLIGDMALSR